MVCFFIRAKIADMLIREIGKEKPRKKVSKFELFQDEPVAKLAVENGQAGHHQP